MQRAVASDGELRGEPAAPPRRVWRGRRRHDARSGVPQGRGSPVRQERDAQGALRRHTEPACRAHPAGRLVGARFRRLAGGADRRADGSRRHQPQRRPVRAAGAPHDRADRAVQSRSPHHADGRSPRRRCRRRRLSQPLQPRPVARGHRALSRPRGRGRRRSLVGRRRPFDDAADPPRGRRPPPGRHGPHRCPLRHRRARST